jgi:hypothetical protein
MCKGENWMLNIYLPRHLDFPHAWKDVSEIRRERHHTTSRYVLFNPNLYIFVATETVVKMIVGPVASKGGCPKKYEILVLF